MKNKTISLCLLLAMVMSMTALFVMPVAAEETAPKTELPTGITPWEGDVATGFASGTGTAEDPYLISSGAELAYLAQEVNTNSQTYADVHFRLTNHINLNGKKWTSIASSDAYAFSGVFDGNNKIIYNIKSAGAWGGTEVAGGGLFGKVVGATIQNVSVHGQFSSATNRGFGAIACITSYRTNDASETVGTTIRNCRVISGSTLTSNQAGAGGIFGKGSLAMNIDGCVIESGVSLSFVSGGGIMGDINYYSGPVVAPQIINCVNYGDITIPAGYTGSIGGITGPIQTNTVGVTFLIQNVKNYGTIDASQGATKCNAGGIVATLGANRAVQVSNAFNYGTVKSSYLAAGIVGTTAGGNNSNANCSEIYNYGDVMIVNPVADTETKAGGIVGEGKANVSKAINYGNVSGATYAGGIVGQAVKIASFPTFHWVENHGSVHGTTYVGGIAGAALDLPGNLNQSLNISDFVQTGTLKATESNTYIGGACGYVQGGVRVQGAVIVVDYDIAPEAENVTVAVGVGLSEADDSLTKCGLILYVAEQENLPFCTGTDVTYIGDAIDASVKKIEMSQLITPKLDESDTAITFGLPSSYDYKNYSKATTALEVLNIYSGKYHKDSAFWKAGIALPRSQYSYLEETDVRATSLTLDANFNINFYVLKAGAAAAEVVTAEVNGSTTTVVQMPDVVKGEETYLHFVAQGIHPSHVGTKANISIKIGDMVTDSVSYGVLDYATRKYNNNNTEGLSELLEAIVHYGNAAEAAKGVTPTVLDTFASKTGYTYDGDYIADKYADVHFMNNESTFPEGVAVSLALTDGITPVIYVNNSDITHISYTCYEETTEQDIAGETYVVVDKLVATSLNNPVTITFTVAGEEVTGTWNVADFIVAATEANGFTAEQVTLAHALAVYMTAARSYKGLKN